MMDCSRRQLRCRPRPTPCTPSASTDPGLPDARRGGGAHRDGRGRGVYAPVEPGAGLWRGVAPAVDAFRSGTKLFCSGGAKLFLQRCETSCKRQPLIRPSSPPLLLDLPAQAFRDNDRIQVQDAAFAEQLWDVSGLRALLEGKLADDGGVAVGLNPNIRIYRYGPGQRFGRHIGALLAAGWLGRRWGSLRLAGLLACTRRARCCACSLASPQTTLTTWAEAASPPLPFSSISHPVGAARRSFTVREAACTHARTYTLLLLLLLSRSVLAHTAPA